LNQEPPLQVVVCIAESEPKRHNEIGGIVYRSHCVPDYRHFHPIVIKGEYYFTDKIWPLLLLAGIAALALSCFVRQTLLSSALGVFGCTCLWSNLELKEQKKRVEKGWFPMNPKHNPLQGERK
jgi:hypothetical protein